MKTHLNILRAKTLKKSLFLERFKEILHIYAWARGARLCAIGAPSCLAQDERAVFLLPQTAPCGGQTDCSAVFFISMKSKGPFFR
jgi:hypothetical protein